MGRRYERPRRRRLGKGCQKGRGGRRKMSCLEKVFARDLSVVVSTKLRFLCAR